MGFKDNLVKKIKIDRLAARIRRSLAGPDSPRRLDRQAMGELLAMGAFTHVRERDLDLYLFTDRDNRRLILALDNELKIYNTTAADIGLRKSPTVKEMVSIRNAIKILNDKDVVVSGATRSLDRVRDDLAAGLDLSFTQADIDALREDGVNALRNNHGPGVVETLDLLADLLGFEPAPKVFASPQAHILGRVERPRAGETVFGPVVAYDQERNTLKMIFSGAGSLDKGQMAHYHRVLKGEDRADLEGDSVWEVLKQRVCALA